MAAKKKASVAKEVAAIGAGAAALAAASYYLFGPGGKAHRKQAKGWMIKAKGEVIDRMEQLADISEPVYNNIVDAVAREYKQANGPSKEELAALVTDLKKSWRTISKSVKKPVAKKKTTTKRVAKKA
jgi:uroporphyrinogen-III decarboxylase